MLNYYTLADLLRSLYVISVGSPSLYPHLHLSLSRAAITASLVSIRSKVFNRVKIYVRGMRKYPYSRVVYIRTFDTRGIGNISHRKLYMALVIQKEARLLLQQ